jgi:hypothetical protein
LPRFQIVKVLAEDCRQMELGQNSIILLTDELPKMRTKLLRRDTSVLLC